jgi:chromate transporter
MADSVERHPEQTSGASGAGASLAPQPPSVAALFLAFLRLGCVSFGGPGMVAYIKRLAVARKRWLREDDFQQGVALCQAVPGATAMQCAAYVGLRARGLGGAVAAYLGFGLPAFLLMLVLSIAYQRAVGIHAVTSALIGLRALVVALVANGAWTFARSSVGRPRDAVMAAATGALFLIGGSPFLIVIGAGLAGALVLRSDAGTAHPEPGPRLGWRAWRAPAAVLAVAVVLVAVLLAADPRLATLGLVMMKVDAFAFGGGFASVPLMYHEVVEARGWLPAAVFLDGIALGQVTPGPIVITATFVGQQVAGTAGALVGTVCIFLPSLFVLVLAGPFFRRLRSSPIFAGVTHALVLSFVGLLASVTIHFAGATPWSLPSAAIAMLGLVALLLQVDVVWVVLAGGLVSAMAL